MAHYRHLEETPWREVEFLPSQEICLPYEIAARGGQDSREEGGLKD